MQDELGLYYHPILENKKIHMYVRSGSDNVEFRMWNADDPQLWEEHGWVPYAAVTRAAEMYDNKNFDPNRAYDIHVAREILSGGD